MIVTTADITDRKYEIIDVIFAFGSPQTGLFKTANPVEAYPKVKELLQEEAKKLDADAIVGAQFAYREAINKGCGSTNVVFEVFAYGTAVKFK